MDLLVVTGLSGAGKSTALRALEDSGRYCVDNLPVPLLPPLIDMLGRRAGGPQPIAVGIDARESTHLEQFSEVIAGLRGSGHRVEILFLDAPSDLLLRRYAETRRRHPMGPLPEAIEAERRQLALLRDQQTTRIDTAALTSRELRQLVWERYGTTGAPAVTLLSFGFKSGVPPESDVVFDVRFLANPFDRDDLRPLTGLDEPTARFVLEQPDAQAMLGRMEDLVSFMVPRVMREGRSYLTVAVGCTGGQHRSVALVEALAERLRAGDPGGRPGVGIHARHRDIAGAGHGV